MPNNNLDNAGLGILTGAASGLIGQGLGIIAGDAQDQRQLKQQKKLQEQQIEGNKEMADYQQKLQMQMWNATNAEAQIKHMENAGLNIGLMYGGSGAGGATTAGSGSGASVTGATATDPSAATQAGTAMGMMLAQQQLITAQTEKTQAETAKIEGVDTEKTTTEIASLTQGITNQKAQAKLTEAQTKLSELEGWITDGSKEDRIEQIRWTAEKAKQDAEIAFNEAYVSQQTQQQKIKIINESAIGATLANIATRTNIELTKEQIKKVANDIAVSWEQIRQGDANIDINNFKEKIKANYPNLMNILGKVADNALEKSYEIVKGKRKEPTYK